jgi:hypothetical protein
MSILNFSDTLFSLSVEDSSVSSHLGSFTNDLDSQLQHITVLMFFDGLFDTERMTLSVTDDLTTPTFTWASTAIRVKTVDSVLETDSAWLGWVRFDFAKQHLIDTNEYHLLMSATNYTETSSLSINMVYDYPVPMNGTRLDSFQQHPIAFQIFRLER